jgi:hypothetical protein
MEKEQIRVEAVKAAAKVASPEGGIGNLIVYARLLTDYIESGEAIQDTKASNHCKANREHPTSQSP